MTNFHNFEENIIDLNIGKERKIVFKDLGANKAHLWEENMHLKE